MNLEGFKQPKGKGIPLDRVDYNQQGVRTINPVEGVASEAGHENWREE